MFRGARNLLESFRLFRKMQPHDAVLISAIQLQLTSFHEGKSPISPSCSEIHQYSDGNIFFLDGWNEVECWLDCRFGRWSQLNSEPQRWNRICKDNCKEEQIFLSLDAPDDHIQRVTWTLVRTQTRMVVDVSSAFHNKWWKLDEAWEIMPKTALACLTDGTQLWRTTDGVSSDWDRITKDPQPSHLTSSLTQKSLITFDHLSIHCIDISNMVTSCVISSFRSQSRRLVALPCHSWKGMSSITTTTGRTRCLSTSSSTTPKPPTNTNNNKTSSNLLWQVGLGVSVVGAYFGANYFINKTKDSINDEGEFVFAADGPGTYISICLNKRMRDKYSGGGFQSRKGV